MFENLRWRITLMFVGLAALLYVTVALLALFMFEASSTSALDKEMRVALSEIGHAIDIEDGTPRFRDWKRKVQTEPPRSLATIQLFDKDGTMLEHYGPVSSVQKLVTSEEVQTDNEPMRVLSSPVIENGVNKGTVQIMLSTRERDQSLKHLQWNIGLVGVLFLAGLAVVSYWITKKVTQPIQDSVEILRSFVADASHELNTPLTIMQARTESLERKLHKLGIEEDDLKIAMSSLERLNQVVNDLLLLSEVEDPLAAISKTRVDTTALADQAISKVKDRFAEKGIALESETLPAVYVKGNLEALQRLLGNLLENALRYTDEGGSVKLQIEATSKEVRLSIKDSGIGIPEQSLPRIFDRFFRVDKSRSRASGGIGLGLSIVRAIADAHRARVTVLSKIGVGTTFTVTMPRMPGAPPGVEVRQVANDSSEQASAFPEGRP